MAWHETCHTLCGLLVAVLCCEADAQLAVFVILLLLLICVCSSQQLARNDAKEHVAGTFCCSP